MSIGRDQSGHLTEPAVKRHQVKVIQQVEIQRCSVSRTDYSDHAACLTMMEPPTSLWWDEYAGLIPTERAE